MLIIAICKIGREIALVGLKLYTLQSSKCAPNINSLWNRQVWVNSRTRKEWYKTRCLDQTTFVYKSLFSPSFNKVYLNFSEDYNKCEWINDVCCAWATLFCLKFKLMKGWDDVSIKRSKYTCVEGMLKQDVHICRSTSATSHLHMFICSLNEREWLHMYMCVYNLFHYISFGKSKHL